MGADQPCSPCLPRQIYHLGQPRRELPPEELKGGLMPRTWSNQRESVGLADDPVVDNQGSFRRKERSVDQAVVARFDQVIGEKPLQACECARTLNPEDGRLGRHQDRAMANLCQSLAIERQVKLGHGPTAARLPRVL